MEAGNTMKIKYIQVGETGNQNSKSDSITNSVTDLDIPINIIDE